MKKLDDPPEIALTFVNKNNIINLVTSAILLQSTRLNFYLFILEREVDKLNALEDYE